MTPTITASSLEETPTIIIDPSEDTDQSTMNQIPAFPSMSLLSPASIRATNRTILYQKNDNQSTDSDSLESLCDYSRCHNEDGFSPPPMSIQPLDYSSVSQQVNSSTAQAFKPLSTDDTLAPENASRLLGEDSGEQTDGYTEREPDGHPNSPPSIKSMIHPIVYPDDVTGLEGHGGHSEQDLESHASEEGLQTDEDPEFQKFINSMYEEIEVSDDGSMAGDEAETKLTKRQSSMDCSRAGTPKAHDSQWHLRTALRMCCLIPRILEPLDRSSDAQGAFKLGQTFVPKDEG